MITVEHLNFIASMENKYDYTSYLSFCSNRGEQAISFMAFAAIVEPQSQPTKSIISIDGTAGVLQNETKTSCCGGAQVK